MPGDRFRSESPTARVIRRETPEHGGSQRLSRPRSRVPRLPVAALRLVAWARERVPLYRELYDGLPPIRTARDFRALPVLTHARLRATPLVAQVDTPDDTIRAFTPYLLRSRPPVPAVPADRGDTDAAFTACRAAFTLAGVNHSMVVVLVSAPDQRYLAAETAEQLGYFGVQAHVLVDGGQEATAAGLSALAPDVVVALGTYPPINGRLVTVRNRDSEGPDLYVVPEAGIVAVRPAGAAAYVPVRGHSYVEADRHGRLLLTALRRFHRPLIRYALPDRGRVADGRLWLDEVAP